MRALYLTTGLRHTCSVHHRDFLEIHAHGEDPNAAAGHLVNALTRALDSALTDWRRESINQAIAQVRAFLEKSGS